MQRDNITRHELLSAAYDEYIADVRARNNADMLDVSPQFLDKLEEENAAEHNGMNCLTAFYKGFCAGYSRGAGLDDSMRFTICEREIEENEADAWEE